MGPGVKGFEIVPNRRHLKQAEELSCRRPLFQRKTKEEGFSKKKSKKEWPEIQEGMVTETQWERIVGKNPSPRVKLTGAGSWLTGSQGLCSWTWVGEGVSLQSSAAGRGP